MGCFRVHAPSTSMVVQCKGIDLQKKFKCGPTFAFKLLLSLILYAAFAHYTY
jgi:hypothetical protein